MDSFMSESKFGVIDYCIFAATLAISFLIGIYFSLRGHETSEDFLMGNRAFGVIPTSMSLLTSFVSAISLLGYSGESYAYGCQMFLFVVGATIGMIFSKEVIIPVIYPLKLTSINEYIQLRFQSSKFTKFQSGVACFTSLLFLGICLYAPTIALVAVTDWNYLTHILLLGVVCTIYSSFGGLRAVIWTDVFQFLVMMGGLIVVTVVGTGVAGGVEKVWKASLASGRLDIFNMNPSIYERHTFFNVMAFGIFYYGKLFGTSPINAQRMCAVSTLSQAKTVLWNVIVGMYVIYILIFFCGLVAYAAYEGCDPYATGLISKKEEIFTFFIKDRLGFVVGLPGVFVATIVGGTLSSLSSVISAITAMIWKDFLANFKCFQGISARAALITNMVISLIIGIVIICLAIVFSRGGGLVQLTVTVLSVAFGSVFGVFIIGILFPKCNIKGAWAGCIVSMIIIGWIAIGALYTQATAPMMPFSAEFCHSNASNIDYINTEIVEIYETNVTSLAGGSETPYNTSNEASLNKLPVKSDNYENPLDYLYGISYTLYAVFGTVICVGVGLLVSYLTGNQDVNDVSPMHVSPLVRQWYYPDFVASEKAKEAEANEAANKASHQHGMNLQSLSTKNEPKN